MAAVSVRLPSVLAQIVGRKSLQIEAETLKGGIEALLTEMPELEVHIFDESGGLRQHVNCFHNDDNTRWLEDLDRPLADGDTITIMQSVSGGAVSGGRA